MTQTQMDVGFCINCGIEFHMPHTIVERLRESHSLFYCPNGHSQFYPALTPEEKSIKNLENQVKHLKQVEKDLAIEQAHSNATLRKLSATRGVVTKLRKKKRSV